MTIRALLASAMVFAVSAARAQAPPPANADFTVATYNINYANRDLREVAQTLLKSGADLVALQETNRQSEAYFRKELARTYPHMIFHPVGDAAGGFAMLSKAPIEKPRYTPPDRGTGGFFGVETARVTLAGREMLVVNVHLMPTIEPRGTTVAELAALYLKSDAVREKEVRAIVDGLPKRWPVLVLGDFNSPPQFSGIPALMAKSGFTDCLAAVLKDADATPTWHWNYNGVNYSTRLDYLFSARLGATPVRGSVTPGEASDHYPVTCAFRNGPLPVALGEARAEALNVVYLVDTAGMTPERAATARGIVSASTAALTDAQNFCVVIPDAKTSFPPELSPATDETRALAADALKKDPAPSAALPPAVRRAIALLEDEASPKALFVLSDRPAKDPALLKSLRALNADPATARPASGGTSAVASKRLQMVLLDAAGTPLGE